MECEFAVVVFDTIGPQQIFPVRIQNPLNTIV